MPRGDAARGAGLSSYYEPRLPSSFSSLLGSSTATTFPKNPLSFIHPSSTFPIYSLSKDLPSSIYLFPFPPLPAIPLSSYIIFTFSSHANVLYFLQNFSFLPHSFVCVSCSHITFGRIISKGSGHCYMYIVFSFQRTGQVRLSPILN